MLGNSQKLAILSQVVRECLDKAMIVTSNMHVKSVCSCSLTSRSDTWNQHACHCTLVAQMSLLRFLASVHSSTLTIQWYPHTYTYNKFSTLDTNAWGIELVWLSQTTQPWITELESKLALHEYALQSEGLGMSATYNQIKSRTCLLSCFLYALAMVQFRGTIYELILINSAHFRFSFTYKIIFCFRCLTGRSLYIRWFRNLVSRL